jgi:hypothetical protein
MIKKGLKKQETYNTKIGSALEPMLFRLPPRQYMDVFNNFKYEGFQSHLDGVKQQQEEGQVLFSNLLNNLSTEINKNIDKNFDERDGRTKEGQKRMAKEIAESFDNINTVSRKMKEEIKKEQEERQKRMDRVGQKIDDLFPTEEENLRDFMEMERLNQEEKKMTPEEKASKKYVKELIERVEGEQIERYILLEKLGMGEIYEYTKPNLVKMAKELGIRNASKMGKVILYNEIINKKTEQMNEETKKKTKKK